MKSEEDVSSRSTEFWGICCEGGKKYSQVVRRRFHITMAALDPTVVPTSPVVSLMVDRGGCEYLLCSLKPGSLLQVNLNLYFDKGEKVIFSLKGSGKIHLSGYILHENQGIQNEVVEKGNSSTRNITKMTSPLKKDELKIHEKSKKDINKYVQDGKKESKYEITMQKNKNKSMQKTKVSDDDDSEMEDDFDELEESTDDEESDDKNKDLKQDSNKLKNYKRLWSSLTQSDEEESSSEEDSDEEVEVVGVKKLSKEEVKAFQDKKKLKTDTSTPVLNKNLSLNTPENSNKFDNKTASLKQKSNDDMNSSIGRTPMPKKKTPKVNQVNLSPKKVNFADIDESSSSNEAVKSSLNILSPTKNDESVSNIESKKKKKKKKKEKDALNISAPTDVSVGKKNEADLVSASYSQKLPGGLEFEDIKVGNGPLAKKGKLVHVYYTGMLANNKVFDSRKPGTKPFSFKLGAEQVIKGWDLGIEGMKVGGKRRLKIPPNLGYKNERMGPIPPMSKLFFTVELKAVS